MAHGYPVSVIIVSAQPQGKFLEGTISGTPKPGTKMQLQAGTAPVGGRFTWEVYNPTNNNDPRLTAILLHNPQDGIGPTTAYANGTRGFLYCPLAGEEMNILVTGLAGTASANALTIGERLSVLKTTGLYTPETDSTKHADFMCLEHIDTVIDTPTLVWAMYCLP